MPRHLRFDVLWLLSEEDGRARQITWAKNTTFLVGGNHTGKSTLVRMLYHAFGCKVKPLGPDWNPRAVVAVTFSIADTQYTIFRRGQVFALFDNNGVLLWATDDQGELRAKFSALIPFILPLVSQQGETKQARPAFFFLPSLIDQDGSWGSSWQTFDSLGEFREWQKPTIELMLSIRDSEYWQTFAALSTARTRVDELTREEKILDDTRKRLSEKFPNKPWFRNALAFRRELSDLEIKVSALASQQQRTESDRLDLIAAQETLRSQTALIESALREHAQDMRFLDERRTNGEIICPTCGTSHENSFHSRLNLEAEADDLRQLRAHFVNKLAGIEKRLEQEEEQLTGIARETEEVERLLESERGELRLREIVRRAGANAAHGALDEQAQSVTEELARAKDEVEELGAKLDGLQDSVRMKEIVRRFREMFNHFAVSLSVPASLATHGKAVHLKPHAGGSGGPRAVLAYYFALAYTAEEFSSGCIPPLVVDSPHQQAQDEIRRPQVTEFIVGNRPSAQQLILGLEDPPPESVVLGPDDKRIDLTRQFSVLSSQEYGPVFAFLEPLWRTAESAVAGSRAEEVGPIS